ncbi:MAG TPA: hypothetical protein VK540_15860 [Polyangiaceae bacterium]|nr:hypothetical protein [Polyangiaceae bacterium]
MRDLLVHAQPDELYVEVKAPSVDQPEDGAAWTLRRDAQCYPATENFLPIAAQYR